MHSEREEFRHRKCLDCGLIFYTIESVVPSEQVAPMFREWQRERSRKSRLKKKGIEYEPAIKGKQETTPKKPTSPLF